MSTPSVAEQLRRNTVGIHQEIVSNQASTDFPGHWPGEDHEWNKDEFAKNLKVEFHTHTPFDMSFSLIHVDTSIANAFRRLLIAEVPTLAIETVYIFQNTSIIQDEVLAHRLGLIPFAGTKEGFDWMKWFPKLDEANPTKSAACDYNTIVLRLDVECTWQEGGLQRAVAGETDPDRLYINHNVYARDIIWEPIGAQPEKFPAPYQIRAVNPDILIVKMRPGQSISLAAHAVKGIGQDHAKFSPVATAAYRLLPTIDILQPIIGADARKFARCFPRGVIKLDAVSAADIKSHPELSEHEGEAKAVVDKPMNDTVSRECLRHAEFKDKVKLGRVRDHFIFRVESTGQFESAELFLRSVRLLKVKALKVHRGLNEMLK